MPINHKECSGRTVWHTSPFLKQVINYFNHELEMQQVFDDDLLRDMLAIIHLMLT